MSNPASPPIRHIERDDWRRVGNRVQFRCRKCDHMIYVDVRDIQGFGLTLRRLDCTGCDRSFVVQFMGFNDGRR